jgi:ABC-type hemin transport system substrate-binding protein
MTLAPVTGPVHRATRSPYHTGAARRVAAAALAVVLALPVARASLADAPRVVSLSPDATDVVVALGDAGRLVAVDPRSARRAGLEGLPTVEDAEALARFSPDRVLAPAALAERVRLALPGVPVVEVEVHDFDSAWASCLAVGDALGRGDAARRFVRDVSRPLARMSAASVGRRRPRVVAITRLDPLEVAGGHGFLADLIQVAGGENVTHGGEERRESWTRTGLSFAEPALALLVAPSPSDADLELARRALGPGVPVEPLAMADPWPWLREAVPTARRVQGWIDAVR